VVAVKGALPSNHPYSQYGADHVDDRYIHLQTTVVAIQPTGAAEVSFLFLSFKVRGVFRKFVEFNLKLQ
jgi:hypothetical protein